jgi:hypothetical protein
MERNIIVADMGNSIARAVIPNAPPKAPLRPARILCVLFAGLLGAGFRENNVPSKAFFNAALVMQVTIVGQYPTIAIAFSIGMPTNWLMRVARLMDSRL